ncbi:MAG: ThiF family adenylyltransferase [Candidatus Doudnabacteria bacterium]|nr:ThiF family adenylyltransferase [Candidatus Doudnabacteria bacterium]
MDKELEYLLNKSKAMSVSMPTIFDLASGSDASELKKLLAEGKILTVVDDFNQQQEELFAINNPTEVYKPGFKEEFENYYKKFNNVNELGKWIYYPWLATLVHLLNDEDFQRVRTARNRNLISEEEQKKFYNSVVGIGGLSVGNSVILAIVLQGGAKHLRLADFDSLALTNLNRIRGGVDSLGIKKVEMTARQIYALNPYAKVEVYPDGLNKDNIEKFFMGPPKLDLVIDELDNIAVKYLIREQAKKHLVPVVMGADNGDNAVVDIERYDKDSNTLFFHGRLGETSFEKLANLDKFGIGRTITQHIGPENITAKMQNSLLEMGKTIVSWPQLGGAALLNGSAVAYCVRRILNNQPLESNRALISLDEKLDPLYNLPESQSERKRITDDFKKMMGL